MQEELLRFRKADIVQDWPYIVSCGRNAWIAVYGSDRKYNENFFRSNTLDIMRHGDDSVPDYMIYLQTGDFTDCPKVTFIYGSDETLYACAPSFEAAMKKYNVDFEMIVGEGMFHCYPVFPLCKEAKEGWDMMIQKVKEKTIERKAS